MREKITNEFFSRISPKTYNELCYYYLHLKMGVFPKKINFDNPKTFNEKIIWLKLHRYDESLQYLVDKVEAREHVRATVGEEILVPTYFIFSDVSEVSKALLPDRFILKMSHGSGWNIACYAKSNFDIEKALRKMAHWESTNYYDIGKELPHKNIKPRVLCEQLLGDESGIEDYKIFCFNGEPAYIQVDYDRSTHHKRIFYDLNWKALPFTTLYPRGEKIFIKPKKLNQMLSIAEKLSRDLPFARIDFYYYLSKIYFSEITLHHGGGFEPFFPNKFDAILGDRIKL